MLNLHHLTSIDYLNDVVVSLKALVLLPVTFYGPHLTPTWVSTPLAVYNGTDNSLLLQTWRRHSVVYQWFNHITGSVYVGSGLEAAARLGCYYHPSNLGVRLERGLAKYGHGNYSIAILKDAGATGTIPHATLLSYEQTYLDTLFATFPAHLVLNLVRVAGTTTGYTHTQEWRNARMGAGNPMSNRQYSPEFIAEQQKDKNGANNPQFGVVKTPETVAKLTKLVSVYNATTGDYLSRQSTVETAKKYPIGKMTLQARIADGKAHKGYFFKREPKVVNER